MQILLAFGLICRPFSRDRKLQWVIYAMVNIHWTSTEIASPMARSQHNERWLIPNEISTTITASRSTYSKYDDILLKFKCLRYLINSLVCCDLRLWIIFAIYTSSYFDLAGFNTLIKVLASVVKIQIKCVRLVHYIIVASRPTCVCRWMTHTRIPASSVFAQYLCSVHLAGYI